MSNDIGKIIHSRRTSLGLTLEEVGQAVGVGKSTVKKWEDGFISNMKRDKIALLANILQVSPVTFITGVLTFEKNEHQSQITIAPELQELHELISRLDPIDRAEIRGMMKQMLRADKYSDKSNSKLA